MGPWWLRCSLCTEQGILRVQVSGCADGNIHLWDVPARRCLRKLVGHTGARGIYAVLSTCKVITTIF